jgi:hypothetical protein
MAEQQQREALVDRQKFRNSSSATASTTSGTRIGAISSVEIRLRTGTR